MDIKGGCEAKERRRSKKVEITWKSDGKMHICRLLTPIEESQDITSRQKRRRPIRENEKGTKDNEINYLRDVHLDDGVRRMSFFTGLLLFFSLHSFTSFHDDGTLEKTILVDDESLTDGINNITFDSLLAK